MRLNSPIWSSEADEQLKALAQERMPVILIAARLHRAERAVRGRAAFLGVKVYTRRALIKMSLAETDGAISLRCLTSQEHTEGET